MTFFRDLSLSAIVAGFVTVLVGFTSSAVIVFEAARAVGANEAQIASWMWALGIGMGITCIGLSLRYRMPVVTAWSTPGAAMLITSAAGVSIEQATGAFVVSAVLILIAGITGWFERLLHRIPPALGAGMLAGVLLRFGLDVFVTMKSQFVLAAGMFVAYLLLRRIKPRYAVVITLLLGIAIAASLDLLAFEGLRLEVARPVWVEPAFSVSALIGIAIPLFVVTMASQNVPGVTVLHASGYRPNISAIIGWTGFTNLLLAPFGAFALNLAAITAAICCGREAHEDVGKRYVAAVSAGVFYLVVGCFGATVAALFAAFPKELISVIAGLALLGTIGTGLLTALSHEREREPALITFLVTASGLAIAGIGSAFWGLVAGVFALFVLRWRERPAAGPA